MMKESVRLLIVDDDPDFLYLIQRQLKKDSRFEIVGCCQEQNTAVAMACRCQPDLVLMDLDLGRSFSDGIQASREIRILTDARVLILTAIESQEVILKASREAFASGYVFKGQPALLEETILALCGGKHTAQEYLIVSTALSCLSEAEMAVFRNLLGQGVHLQSSPKTIANQTTRILQKLGLESKRDLIHVFGMLQEEKHGKA
ncbi:MAG: response regulator transcription factor [Candidatus Limivivens sp.]|nr:response regulator transcription factor [Candidatus Limivivens sp.]